MNFTIVVCFNATFLSRVFWISVFQLHPEPDLQLAISLGPDSTKNYCTMLFFWFSFVLDSS